MSSPTPGPDPESVLDGLQPREHEPDATLDYEINRQLIGRVLALYSARRAELEQTDPVDHPTLNETVPQQRDLAQLMQGLDPADAQSAARVRVQYANIPQQADASGQSGHPWPLSAIRVREVQRRIRSRIG